MQSHKLYQLILRIQRVLDILGKTSRISNNYYNRKQ